MKLILGDCLEEMPKLSGIDAVITDPPYPDYHAELYGYDERPILYLDKFDCRQLVFWTSKMDFILDYTAIHIWDKMCGVGSMYERLFERKGGNAYMLFNYYLINSTVAAQYTGDTFYNHPSQKPVKLMSCLVKTFHKTGLILDPFMGSGTTLRAAKDLNRKAIGIEIEEKYCEIAARRMQQEVLDFEPQAEQEKE